MCVRSSRQGKYGGGLGASAPGAALALTRSAAADLRPSGTLCRGERVCWRDPGGFPLPPCHLATFSLRGGGFAAHVVLGDPHHLFEGGQTLDGLDHAVLEQRAHPLFP